MSGWWELIHSFHKSVVHPRCAQHCSRHRDMAAVSKADTCPHPSGVGSLVRETDKNRIQKTNIERKLGHITHIADDSWKINFNL